MRREDIASGGGKNERESGRWTVSVNYRTLVQLELPTQSGRLVGITPRVATATPHFSIPAEFLRAKLQTRSLRPLHIELGRVHRRKSYSTATSV